MSDFKYPLSIGNWCWKKLLGKGSFGEVSLWKNCKTGDQIAIKKCIIIDKNASQELVDKLKQRWYNEVHMIESRIQNENIIRAIKVNMEFIEELNKTNISGLPLLIMEYCDGGDLRKIISENYYGLQEPDILNILKSLKNAVNYLHEIGITHRDIKPENIVIQIKGENKIYKLTDLGYAKDIQYSVDASHVGTVGYFAPELIMNKKYSCTVDYWSMGIIIFEVICGRRPFVPHLRLANGFQLILKKKLNDIAISENIKGEFIYHNKLFQENHINSVLKRYLETWLKTSLDLDGRRRGSINDIEESSSTDANIHQRKKIFTQIEEILSLNILTLFCLSTYQFLSYEISNEMILNELIKMITKDTNIEERWLYIILPLEQIKIEELTNATKPIDLILKNNETHTPMLYVTDIQAVLDADKIQPRISDAIKENMTTKRYGLKLFHLLEFSRQALYFIENEERLYLTFLRGLRNYGIYLNDLVIKFKETINNMFMKINQLVGAMNFQCVIYNFHKKTLESKHRKKLCVKNMEKWDRDNNEIAKNIKILSDEISKILKRYESILNRSNEVKDHNLFEGNSGSYTECKRTSRDYFGVVKIRQLCGKIRMGEHSILHKYHKEICDLIRECLQTRGVLLQNSHLKNIQISFLTINKEFTQIQMVSRSIFDQLVEYASRINLLYMTRFNDIWQAMENNEKENCEEEDRNKILIQSVRNVNECILEESMKNLDISYSNEENAINTLIGENNKLRKIINDLFLDISSTEED